MLSFNYFRLSCLVPLLLAAGVLAATGTAGATIRRNPVRVRLEGPPRAAEPGKPFTAVFKFESRVNVTLDEVYLNLPPAWRLLTDPLPGRLPLRAGEARSIPFTILTDDPSQQITLEYQLDNEPVQKRMDLSPARIEEMKPRADRLSDSPMPEAMPSGSFLMPEPASPRLDPRHREVESGDAEAPRNRFSPAAGRDIRVVGWILYPRMNDGVQVGIDGATARIYDEDTGPDELLATQIIPPNGRLDVTFHWDPCFGCDGTPDLYVEIEFANNRVEVQEDSIFEDDYSFQTGVWNDYGGSFLDIGTRLPSDPFLNPAAHILTTMTRAWRFSANTGRDAPIVDVQWPDPDCATGCYNDFWEEIHIPVARQWDENTLVHEWGHHWVNTFSEIQDPAYCNGFCDTNIAEEECGHCLWCRETATDAFNEGFPNYYADVVIRDFNAAYGRGPVTPLTNFETSQRCANVPGADNQLHDVWTTEAAFTALLHDIDDAAADNDSLRAQGQDELNMGFDEIFWLIDTFPITSPGSFIARFKTEYPGLKEQFWATAANNGYQTDFYQPGLATNVTSDHFLNSQASTRPYITWSWNRASDDMSGISGYSVLVMKDFPFAAPDYTQDIGDVTTWTSGPHTAGWYYFAIRTRDRNGLWSDNYELVGPYGIRNPDPANLKVKIHTNWDNLGVTARHVPDATQFSTSAPSYLDGAGGTTYLSAIFNNSGEQATNSQTGQFWTTLFVDGAALAFHHNFAPLGPGQYDYILNKPVTIAGGRHTVRVQLDESELLPEPDELDNYWARQWGWTPPWFGLGAPVNLSSPAYQYQDTNWIVDGSAWYPNCRGFRIQDEINWANNMYNNTWTAVAIHAPGAADYDLNIHEATSSPTAAFTTSYGYSVRGAYATDVILTNSWQGWGVPVAFDYGILNYNGGSGGLHLQKVRSGPIGFPGSMFDILNDNEMIKLYEATTPGGRVYARVKVQDPSLGRVYLTIVPNTAAYWTALPYAGTTVTSSATTGEAVIDQVVPQGSMCIIVWRDPPMGTGTLGVDVSVQATPPDMAMATPAGWAAPLVPRPAGDGAPGAVPAPAFLIGDMPQTYLNYAFVNGSTVGMPTNPVLTAFYADGLWFSSDNPPAAAAGATVTRNLAAPVQVRSGRHVLGVHIDPTQQNLETSDDNNWTAGQWVWRPSIPSFDLTQALAMPAQRYAGWNLMPGGSPLWFNMDAMRMNTSVPDGSGNGWKVAALAIPDAGKDVDLKLYEIATTATTGFDTPLASSEWGIDQPDFVIADFRVTAARQLDVGVLAPVVQPGTSLLEMRRSKYLGAGPAAPDIPVASAPGATRTLGATAGGNHGPFTIGAGDLFDLYEVDLPVGTYTVKLLPGTGSVDWGVALFGPGQAFASRSGALSGGTAWEAPAGSPELMNLTINQAGPHSVVVWKNRRSEVNTAGTFTLQFVHQTTGVPGGAAPVAVRLISGVQPNPFTTAAEVSLSLKQAGGVTLQVFGLSGRRIRNEDLGRRAAGAHVVSWDGRDDSGEAVPAGIYFVRVLAGADRDERKIVRVR